MSLLASSQINVLLHVRHIKSGGWLEDYIYQCVLIFLKKIELGNLNIQFNPLLGLAKIINEKVVIYDTLSHCRLFAIMILIYFFFT